MIAVDSNILVYSVRADSPWHSMALRCLQRLAEGEAAWALAWPCIHEFIGIVTHPRIYKPPTPLRDALAQVENWMESPSLHVLGEGLAYWGQFRLTATAGKIAGPLVHDARVAAIYLEAGVRELWTADRDYSRFVGLSIRNPLIDQP